MVISLLAVAAAYLVSSRVFEYLAHIEDEQAYLWQAQAVARGKLTVPIPPGENSFLVPFVVDYNGQRFGKYPPGWPALLGIGVRLGLRAWVNPLLAGLGVWLTYRLGKRTFGEAAGLLAAGLTLTSPFFLMNSGSLLSHSFGLVLSAAFAMAWLDLFADEPFRRPWLPTLVAGLCLGLMALTRPLTAVAVAAPFGLHGLYLLVRGEAATRRRLLRLGLIVLAMASLHFVWQFAVTGDPFINPYTLWWEYDRIGFGPGIGRVQGGHNLGQAYVNTNNSLLAGVNDLFGWGPFSWILLPFGVLATLVKPRSRPFCLRALLIASVFPSLVLFYLAYWIGASLFGPRYYYEGLFSLTIFSAVGFGFLAGWPTRPGEPWRCETGWRKLRPLGMTALLALLVGLNLIFYTPMRVGGMHGLYGVERAHITPFLTPQAQELAPALIVVHPQKKWIEYGTLLELENPFLDTPFIFIISRGPEVDNAVAAHFPERNVYHYYQDEPYKFYTAPREKR